MLKSDLLLDLPGAVVYYNSKRNILYANDKFLSIWKYSRNEIIGQDFSYFFTDKNLDDSFLTSVNGEKIQFTAIDKQKREFPINVCINKSIYNGSEAFLAMFDDVSDLQHDANLINDITSTELKTKPAEVLLGEIIDAVIVTDTDGKIIQWMGNAQEVFGYSAEEVCGRYPNNVFRSDILKETISHIIEAIITKGSFTGQVHFIKIDDSIGLVEVTAKAINDDNGNPLSIVFTCKDLIKANIGKQKIHHLEHQFKVVWEKAANPLRLTDKDGIIISINDAYCKMVGLSRSDLIGKPFSILYKYEQRDSILSYYKQRFLSKEIETFLQKEITLWNDEKVFIELTSTFLDLEDGQLLLLSVIRDISAYIAIENSLKREKEELSVILKSIGEGVISTNDDDKIILMNKAIEDIFGYKSEDLSGMYMIELFELLKTNYQFYEGNLNYNTLYGMHPNNPLMVSERIEIETKSGEKKTLLCSSSEVKKQKGTERGYVYVFKDITKQIEVETQLLLAQKMESIGQLAAGIAHEINTPMQYINDNTSFLEDAFSSIKQYVDTLNELITDNEKMDGFQFLKSKKVELDIDYLTSEIPVAISQSRFGIDKVSNIVRAMKDFSHPGLKEKVLSDINRGIEITSIISKNEWKYVAELELNLDDTLPPVFCNIDEINQVVLNMIVNGAHAIKEKNDSSQSQKGKITIFTELNFENVEIKITDTGAGIKSENISRIFNPFFTTKEVGKGTGQGLAIAHNIIVNNHKGEILVDSVLGEGTTFTIKIPINGA
jgi:PAS domain S-box-containing protein